ncbi:cytochrome P450 3A2-like [Acanthaster planci]|uniref:Cytochrome P450 3A2-like n=1 Tax=Acanthaster planci TaxID=133434 RepID=A0A8B7ZYE8_ACAPL|nr:cytochrome P450 3A2-like [Acanthaster planci]
MADSSTGSSSRRTSSVAPSDDTSDVQENCGVTVMQPSNGVGCRKWDKKHFCFYCDVPQAKLPRNLQLCHRGEREVVEIACELNASLQQVLSPMNRDDVALVVKNDTLIVELAKREYMKLGHDVDQHGYIRNRAVHDISGFREDKQLYDVLSLALKIGHSIKKCALLKGSALEYGQKHKAERVEEFLQVTNSLNVHTAQISRSLHKGNNNFGEECVRKYGKVVGIYKLRSPLLYVSDIGIVKKVLVTDFSKFPNHWDIPALGFPLDKALTYMKGQRWKDARAIVTASFTANKLKQMVDIFNDICDPLLENIENAHLQNKPIDAKKVFLSFVLQNIVAITLGLDVSCQKNLDHPFVRRIQRAFNPTLFTLIPILFPPLGPLFELMGANIIPNESVEFFKKVIHQSLEGGDMIQQCGGKGHNKYTAMIEEIYKYTDLPDTLPPPEQTGKPKRLTYKEFLGGSVLAFAANNEATSTILTCTAYQLALSPEVQDKLIEEIDRIAPTPADIKYDTMNKMKYMETVIYECFRLYPPVVSTDRECLETVTYGKYTLPKGLVIHIPAYSVQHDEDVWPDPEKFHPERFSPENKASIEPVAWLPFGGGPRTCVAVKFITLLIKVFLTRVLQKYRFETCPETPIPLKMKKMTMLEPQDVYVRVVPKEHR